MTPTPSLFDRLATRVASILRGHPPADEQTTAAFEAQGRAHSRRGAQTLCLLAIALITASAIINAASPAGLLSSLLPIRVGAIVALVLIIWLLRGSYGEHYPRELALLAVAGLAVTLATVAFYTGGHSTDQHFRMNFLILAAAVFMSYGLVWSAVFSLTVLGLHLLVMTATGHTMASLEALRNLGFMSASAVTALVITFTRERVRWRDFCRRREFTSVQREVIEREQRYHSLVETAGSAIILVAPDHRVLELNREFERVLGRKREDIIGNDAFELFLPQKIWERTAEAARRVLAGELIRGLEGSILRADGEKRILLWNISCFRDGEGNAVGIIGVGQDITERRQAEREVQRLNAELEQRVADRTAELQESEERFRSIFESSPVGMVIADRREPKISRTNKAFERLMGYTQAEFQGMNTADVTHPEDVETSEKELMDLGAGKTQSYQLEKRYLRKDGSILWSDTSVFAVRDDTGKIRHAFAMVQDITERKHKNTLQRAETRALELLSQRATLAEALTALLEALEELEPGMIGSIMLIDEPGVHLEQVAAPRLPEEYRRALDRIEILPTACSYGTSAYGKTSVVTEDISRDPLWSGFRHLASRHGIRACWSYPIVSAAGKLLGILSMHHRRTCRPTESETELVNAAVHVASIIIERKRDADLIRRHQMEMAHASRVSLVGELAASLAHDLHQPLAAITNYASGCVRRIDAGTGDLKQLVYPMEQIRLLALRAGEIIRHLRSLVRKGGPQQEQVDLNDLVRSAIRLAEPEARQQGITLRLSLEAEIPLVEVDSVQIEQVLLNLVSNGIEAMTDDHANGRELVVKSSLGAEGTVVLAVSDSGISLSPSNIERAFEPFYTTKTHGLGMGLAISRSIVEAQGGRMWAESNPDGGMTFQFTLPGLSTQDTSSGQGPDPL